MIVAAVVGGVYIIANDASVVGIVHDVPGITAIIELFKEGVSKFA